MTASLGRLLRPRSIAVVGGREAERVVEQCDRFGFDGAIRPVNPRRDSMRGRPCVSRVADLPEPPDAAFIAVPREATVDCVKELAGMGAGGAVCYASGFLESEDEAEGGRIMQERLVSAAGTMPVVGPNCYGLLNAATGAALWPDQHGLARCDRGVAVLLQSSNLAINLSMQRRNLPIAFLATMGNQAITGMSDLAAGLLEDPGITALGLHIEGIDSVRGFERMAEAARSLDKPVVALPVGRSDLARTASRSHTAAVAGGAAATEGFLRRLGIAPLRSIPELVESLQLLHSGGPLSGSEVCSLSCSGGEAALVADAGRHRAISFRPLDPDRRTRIKATLPQIVAVSNPLDYHTFHWGNGEALHRTFTAMIEERYDLAMLILDDPNPERCDGSEWAVARQAWIKAVADTGSRAAVVATLPENIDPGGREELARAGVPTLAGIDESMAAVEAAAFIGQARRRPIPQPVLCAPPAPASPELLDELESKRLLAGAGIEVPRGIVASTAEEAAAAAKAIGGRVAIKRLGVAHKSEAGAVRLNVAGEDAARDEARSLLALAGDRGGLLVEEMVADGVAELHLGLLRDPACGLSLTLGGGGVLVELLADTITLPLPATRMELRDSLLGLRAGRLVAGYRRQREGDVEAAVEAAMALGRLAEEFDGRIEEVDVNPLIVRPLGLGAVAADGLVRLRPRENGSDEGGKEHV